MVGTSQKEQPGWLSAAINLYSSYDLESWKFEAEIFKNTSITTPLPPGESRYRIERPKIIFNQATNKYVLWFHLDSPKFALGMVGVCTSSSITGPFKFEKGFQPDGKRSLDMTLFQDDDGSAYLVRSVDNQYAGFSRLSDDYLSTTGIISRGPRCEGQAVWRDGNTYFLLGSHLTGWASNAAILSKAEGGIRNGTQWTVLGIPSGDATTFNSQSTYVLPYTHPATQRRLHIYLGDRWNEAGAGSVGNASYVWLPLVRNASTPALFSMSGLADGRGDGSWRISDY